MIRTKSNQIQISPDHHHHHHPQRQRRPDIDMETAINIVEKFEAKTTTYRNEKLQIDWQSIALGQELGKGAFSTVYKVSVSEPTLIAVHQEQHEDETEDNCDDDDCGLSSPCCKDDNDDENDDNRYCALKCLSSDKIYGSKQSFVIAVIDLIMEAEILSQLNHENIITLRGVCSGSVADSFIASSSLLSSSPDAGRGYFLILDLLNGTLRDKLKQWQRNKQKRSLLSRTSDMVDTILNNNSQHHDKKLFSTSYIELLKRIETVGLQVAKGMEYLHDSNIILRDLKPENVGFDAITNQVKLFDFGLARHSTSSSCQEEIAGSIRYMAPEARLGSGSTKSSDVYSFGVMLWEICSLIKPFSNFQTLDAFNEKVLIGNWRPNISKSTIPSQTLRHLIKDCWDPNDLYRPEFSTIVTQLQHEVTITTTNNTKITTTATQDNNASNSNVELSYTSSSDDDNTGTNGETTGRRTRSDDNITFNISDRQLCDNIDGGVNELSSQHSSSLYNRWSILSPVIRSKPRLRLDKLKTTNSSSRSSSRMNTTNSNHSGFRQSLQKTTIKRSESAPSLFKTTMKLENSEIEEEEMQQQAEVNVDHRKDVVVEEKTTTSTSNKNKNRRAPASDSLDARTEHGTSTTTSTSRWSALSPFTLSKPKIKFDKLPSLMSPSLKSLKPRSSRRLSRSSSEPESPTPTANTASSATTTTTTTTPTGFPPLCSLD